MLTTPSSLDQSPAQPALWLTVFEAGLASLERAGQRARRRLGWSLGGRNLAVLTSVMAMWGFPLMITMFTTVGDGRQHAPRSAWGGRLDGANVDDSHHAGMIVPVGWTAESRPTENGLEGRHQRLVIGTRGSDDRGILELLSDTAFVAAVVWAFSLPAATVVWVLTLALCAGIVWIDRRFVRRGGEQSPPPQPAGT